MTINLFANVLNDDVIDNLTNAQADAVLAIFDKPTPRVAPIDPANIERAQAAALAAIEEV